MAVGTKTSQPSQKGGVCELFSQASSSGSAQTLSTDTSGVRRLVQVTIKYGGGSPSGTATLTLNSVVGAAYDTLVQSITIGGTDTVFIPDNELWITDGDAFDLVVPAVTSQVSSAVIYTEKI